jgi:hypothetical protein
VTSGVALPALALTPEIQQFVDEMQPVVRDGELVHKCYTISDLPAITKNNPYGSNQGTQLLVQPRCTNLMTILTGLLSSSSSKIASSAGSNRSLQHVQCLCIPLPAARMVISSSSSSSGVQFVNRIQAVMRMTTRITHTVNGVSPMAVYVRESGKNLMRQLTIEHCD